MADPKGATEVPIPVATSEATVVANDPRPVSSSYMPSFVRDILGRGDADGARRHSTGNTVRKDGTRPSAIQLAGGGVEEGRRAGPTTQQGSDPSGGQKAPQRRFGGMLGGGGSSPAGVIAPFWKGLSVEIVTPYPKGLSPRWEEQESGAWGSEAGSEVGGKRPAYRESSSPLMDDDDDNTSLGDSLFAVAVGHKARRKSSATAFTINSDDPSAPQPWIRRTSGLLLFLSLSMFAVEAAAYGVSGLWGSWWASLCCLVVGLLGLRGGLCAWSYWRALSALGAGSAVLAAVLDKRISKSLARSRVCGPVSRVLTRGNGADEDFQTIASWCQAASGCACVLPGSQAENPESCVAFHDNSRLGCVDEAALLSRLLLCTSLLAWAMAVTCALAAFGPYWRSSAQWWLRWCRRKTGRGRAADRKGGKNGEEGRTVTAVGLDVTDL